MDQRLTPLGAAVGELLKQRKETLAVAESSAGGLINAAALSVPGASAYYLGGVIIYTRPGRTLLGITKEDMAGIRSASEPFALLMARRIRDKLGATWGLAETGAAGPAGNSYGDPAGHACFAIAGPVEQTATFKTWSADRESNMWAFTRRALTLLEGCLAEDKKK